MIQGQGDKADWVRVASAAGGPHTDYSNLGKCSGEYTQPSANTSFSEDVEMMLEDLLI